MARNPFVTEDASTDELRLAREQTSRAALEDCGIDGEWSPIPFTMAPPAREHYEQYWVRVQLGGQDDIKNYLRQYHRGWRPRPADTLPEGYAVLRRRMNSQWGVQGDVICNQDCVLMERSESLGNKIRAYYERQAQRLYGLIREFVGSQMPRGHGTGGGQVERLDISEMVGNGRIPPVAN